MLEDCILNDEFNFLLTGAQRYAAYQKKAEAMETLISRIRSILDVSVGDAPQEISTPVEEKTTVQKNKKTNTVVLGEAVCPACGSAEVTYLPRRVKRSSFFEKFTMLLSVGLAIVGSFLAMIVSSFVVPFDMFELTSLIILLGGILGAIIGDCMSKTIVKRNRIRKHLPNKCYRCDECKKVFLSDK
jgi:hypothetical protein